MDSLLAEHEDSSCLTFKLHSSTGYDYVPLGSACIPLPHLVHDLCLAVHAAKQTLTHHAQVCPRPCYTAMLLSVNLYLACGDMALNCHS